MRIAWLPPGGGGGILPLFVAYRLELDNAFRAGITATVVCQPSHGSSLQKGRIRIVSTFVGAVAIMTAIIPQSRAGMLLGLALWVGFCGGVATALRNVDSYGGALAGFTAALLFSDVIADPNETFLLAFTRTAEIGIGIVSAGLALIVTDTGTARHRLADAFANTAQPIARAFADLMIE